MATLFTISTHTHPLTPSHSHTDTSTHTHTYTIENAHTQQPFMAAASSSFFVLTTLLSSRSCCSVQPVTHSPSHRRPPSMFLRLRAAMNELELKLSWLPTSTMASSKRASSLPPVEQRCYCCFVHLLMRSSSSTSLAHDQTTIVQPLQPSTKRPNLIVSLCVRHCASLRLLPSSSAPCDCCLLPQLDCSTFCLDDE
uniref:Uncharacterized protein n=1 Tax=Nicotiana tabacum TaxID=4097 RepID=A0A1S4CW69_TOBAC|nr:PREDICTED: uncharacterized protein LOC107823166 [Nicotiana tabacum]